MSDELCKEFDYMNERIHTLNAYRKNLVLNEIQKALGRRYFDGHERLTVTCNIMYPNGYQLEDNVHVTFAGTFTREGLPEICIPGGYNRGFIPFKYLHTMRKGWL